MKENITILRFLLPVLSYGISWFIASALQSPGFMACGSKVILATSLLCICGVIAGIAIAILFPITKS